MKRGKRWGWVGCVVVVGVVGAAVGWPVSRNAEPTDRPLVAGPVAAAMSDRVAPAITVVLDSPLATPEATPSPAAYPLATLPVPTATPPAADYVPPPMPHVNRVAPATPTGVDIPAAKAVPAPGLSPRVWLYVAFIAATLAIVAGLVLMVDRGLEGRAEPQDVGPGDDPVV
jgi:hypothetical protein